MTADIRSMRLGPPVSSFAQAEHEWREHQLWSAVADRYLHACAPAQRAIEAWRTMAPPSRQHHRWQRVFDALDAQASGLPLPELHQCAEALSLASLTEPGAWWMRLLAEREAVALQRRLPPAWPKARARL